MAGETDFIVSELLSELKAENGRKDKQIQSLHRAVATITVVAMCTVLLVVAGFLWYLNQYDFSATETVHETITAEGVYAIVDSAGNVISSDLTVEEIQALMKEMIVDGNGDTNQNGD